MNEQKKRQFKMNSYGLELDEFNRDKYGTLICYSVSDRKGIFRLNISGAPFRVCISMDHGKDIDQAKKMMAKLGWSSSINRLATYTSYDLREIGYLPKNPSTIHKKCFGEYYFYRGVYEKTFTNFQICKSEINQIQEGTREFINCIDFFQELKYKIQD